MATVGVGRIEVGEREATIGCGSLEGDIRQLVGRGTLVDIARDGRSHKSMATQKKLHKRLVSGRLYIVLAVLSSPPLPTFHFISLFLALTGRIVQWQMLQRRRFRKVCRYYQVPWYFSSYSGSPAAYQDVRSASDTNWLLLDYEVKWFPFYCTSPEEC